MLKSAIILAIVAVHCAQARNMYFLYTKNNPTVPDEIIDTNVVGTHLIRNNNTVILIHGHGGSARTSFNSLITDNILRFQEPHNVIVVDWEQDASYSYSIASARVPFVARDLEHLLRWLTEFSGTQQVLQLHLVGFGLGAHIAGIASRWLGELGGYPGGVARITGLDPSGSGWGADAQGLRKTDAHYVEVIHTDGSGLLANGIGTPIGDVNFYVNGGSNQPGCLSHSCNHNRAHELFAASMYNHNLVGFACTSMAEMNLNRCRGTALTLGGTEMFKRVSSSIYRINTRTFLR